MLTYFLVGTVLSVIFYFDETFWWVDSGIIVLLMNIYQTINEIQQLPIVLWDNCILFCFSKCLLTLLTHFSVVLPGFSLRISISSIYKGCKWKLCHLHVLKIYILLYNTLPLCSFSIVYWTDGFNLNIVQIFNSFLCRE